MNQLELEKAVRKNVHELLEEKKYVSSVDLLMKLGYLSKPDYEKWRFGKVDYLERLCKVNLSKLTLINKELRIISKELNLKASWTAYMKHGKGAKKKLRFSKSNKESIERAYATHYVLPKRPPIKPKEV